jgi:hypothetical protein
MKTAYFSFAAAIWCLTTVTAVHSEGLFLMNVGLCIINILMFFINYLRHVDTINREIAFLEGLYYEESPVDR